jgi:hypothetical protein
LNHRAAGLVAGRAADAAAVFRILAFTLTAREIALATGDTIPRAIAAAQAVGQHPAQVLQRAAGNLIVAPALDLAAVRRLFELDGATRQHAPIRRRRRTGRYGTGLPARVLPTKGCSCGRTAFEQSA